MKKCVVTLSSDGLDHLLNFLDNRISDLSKVEHNVMSELADFGVKKASEYLANITDLDGNDVGTIGKTVGVNKATVYHEGDDVMYLEYGTGIMGKASPHPNSALVNWEYDVDTIHKRNFSDGRGWYYVSSTTGHAIRTHGIVGSRHMYKTAIALQDKIPKLKKEIF